MINRSGGLYFSKAATQPRRHKISIQQQYSSSGTTVAVLQALAFISVVTMYVCVIGAQQQEIEPRPH